MYATPVFASHPPQGTVSMTCRRFFALGDDFGRSRVDHGHAIRCIAIAGSIRCSESSYSCSS